MACAKSVSLVECEIKDYLHPLENGMASIFRKPARPL